MHLDLSIYSSKKFIFFRNRWNSPGLMAAGTLNIHDDDIQSLQIQVGWIFQVFILLNFETHRLTHVIKHEQLI